VSASGPELACGFGCFIEPIEMGDLRQGKVDRRTQGFAPM
jgi:hypothetical protein